MKFNPLTFNHFLYGFVPGILLPIVFMWAYLAKFYPGDAGFVEIIGQIYNKVLFGKLLLLSSMPNMGLAFVFYKTDTFKTAAGMMLGGMPYLISSFYFL